MASAPPVEAWLTQEQMNPTPVALDGVTLALQADDVLVTRFAGEDKILLAVAIGLTDDETRGSRPAPLGDSTLDEIITLLHARCCSFRFEPGPESPSRLVIAQAIYDDGCTKDRFMTALAELRSTSALVRLAIRRSQSEPSAPSARSTGRRPTSSQEYCASCGARVTAGGTFCSKCGERVS